MNLLFGLDIMFWQWLIVVAFGILFFVFSPIAKNAAQFFNSSSSKATQPGVFVLTSSLVISWIFAKSITNAANLGLEFGFSGGVAYAVYYFSFLVAGIVIYYLRTKGGFSSIHHFLNSKFGRPAVVVFSILIAFRLFNEVWSNTMVIGSYFGDVGSESYYAAILIFTGLTLAYTLKGGLRSSLLTDTIQMALFAVLLTLLLSYILPNQKGGISNLVTTGNWTEGGAFNLMLVAVIQVFSYPFHDPVLTDRGFISSPKITLKSFLLASIIGFVCISLFSLVGVFGKLNGVEGEAAVEVSKMLGVVAILTVNFIMVTSAASTLDSTFSSFSKLVVIDIAQKPKISIKRGRIVMVWLTVLGVFPVFANPEILSATTISGTMVLGLAPVFLLWKVKAPSLSFHLAIASGILVGVAYLFNFIPDFLIIVDGKYNRLLSANLLGMLLCFMAYGIPVFIRRWKE